MQAALDHLRAQGETLNDEDIARLSPALPRTYQYARPLFLHAGRTGDQRTSETIKRGVRRQKTLLNVSFRSTERQTPIRAQQPPSGERAVTARKTALARIWIDVIIPTVVRES